MATQTRFKGLEGETLSQLTIKQNDMIQVRHEVGTANDSDKGLPFSVLQSIPIAVCISAASETNKTATIDNFADFELQNGREVIVYMANANTATDPTLTINGVGFAAMESGVWQAGTFIKCKYVSINVSGSQITRWLVDAGAYNTTTQLNGALAEVNHDLNYRVSVFKITANYDPTNLDSLREVILSNINLASGYTRTCIFEITNLGNQMSAVWVSVVSSAYFSCIVNSYYFTNAFLRYSGGSWIN